jgi:hypothetical protein
MPRRRAADSRPIAADQDQIDEAELGDRGGNLGDLFVRMRAGIAGVGSAGREVESRSLAFDALPVLVVAGG